MASSDQVGIASYKFNSVDRKTDKVKSASFYHVLLRIGSIGGLAGMLAACASNIPQQRQQQVPIAQEVAHYQAKARSYYTPPGPPEDPWGPYIQEAANRFDVPEAWIRAVMQQESGGSLYHNGQLVTSGPGAMGLMQLMPPTYDEMKIAYNLGDDAYDPHDNIMAGTAYIRQMYDIYGSPGFLAAYNGGPGRLDDFLTRNRTLPLETRRYVASIGPQIQGIKPNRQSQADLLVQNHESGDSVNAMEYASATQPGSQTIALSPQAQAVQQAWAGRQTTDRLNQASLNGVSTATTESLNGQSLKQSGKNKSMQVAMAAPARNTSTTYPVQWKNFDVRSSAAQATSVASETRQDISSAWQARGYQPTPVRNVQSYKGPVQVASAPEVNPAIYQRRYYKPISYQFPAASASVTPKHSTTKKLNSSAKSSFASVSGAWGIQVGAFASSAQAKNAAGKARNQALLRAGKQQVQVVQKGRSKIYRARVTGLSQASAQSACRKLASCLLIRPSS